MEILLAILQENLAPVLGGGLIIAAFVRHMMAKGSDRSGPVDDYYYNDYDDEPTGFRNCSRPG